MNKHTTQIFIVPHATPVLCANICDATAAPTDAPTDGPTEAPTDDPSRPLGLNKNFRQGHLSPALQTRLLPSTGGCKEVTSQGDCLPLVSWRQGGGEVGQ